MIASVIVAIHGQKIEDRAPQAFDRFLMAAGSTNYAALDKGLQLAGRG